MKSAYVALGIGALLALAAPPVFGTTADFSPPNAAVTAGTTIITQLDVTAEILTDFDFAYIVIGSDDATDLSFGFDSGWTTAFNNNESGPFYDSEGFYLQEIVVGGDNNDQGVGSNSLTVGSLSIDTTGMALGAYTISIDYDLDASSLLATTGEETVEDPMHGSFGFTIVPEPGAFVLSLFAGMGLVRRRR